MTVALVGDSRYILDSKGAYISLLTVDHRLENRERVKANDGEVGRLNLCGGHEVPLTDLEIEELVVEFLEIESKLNFTISTEIQTFREEWEAVLDDLETKSALLLAGYSVHLRGQSDKDYRESKEVGSRSSEGSGQTEQTD
ncbi:putative protein phosphatase 2C 33 [Platanthera zijinensis]|uniref:protein-serine/threonine phosphatase n=1 Tax=Platanthera zijinensis TaxID=2320716 RepID=A0AAP0BJ23_9ASPA